MSMLERWNPFAKKKPEQPAHDPAWLKQRLGIPDAPREDEARGALGEQLKARREQQAREQESRERVEHAADSVLSTFAEVLTTMERPDQYLPALEKVFKDQKATPEVVTRVVERCRTQLDTFYRTHAGSGHGTYDRGLRATQPTTEHSLRLVPDAFTQRGRIDGVGGMLNRLNAWRDRIIAEMAAPPAAQAPEKKDNGEAAA